MRSHLKVIKDLMIVAALALSVTLGYSVRVFAQEKQDKDKDEKTITLKIVRDDNGKVTVIDTTYTLKGEGNAKEYEYEYTLRDLDNQVAELEVRMKDLDSVIEIGDSIEKHIIIRGMGADCDRPCPGGAVFFGDDEGMRQFSWEGDMEDFMPRPPVPPQWEALLQSIPMGRITGFQVKDRKDGKRIIIDVDDEYPVVIMAPYKHRDMNHNGKKIIIEREINDIPPPPPPPPPPPADQKEPAPKPDKG